MAVRPVVLVAAGMVFALFFLGLYSMHTAATRSDDAVALREEHLRQLLARETQRADFDTKLASLNEQIKQANAQLRDLRKTLDRSSTSGDATDGQSVVASTNVDGDVTDAALQVLPQLHRIHKALRQHQYSSAWVHRKATSAMKDLMDHLQGEHSKLREKGKLVAGYLNNLIDNNYDDLLADQLDNVFHSTLFGVEITKRAEWLRDLLREDLFYVQFPSLLERFNYQRRGLEAAQAAAALINPLQPDELSRKACKQRKFILCDLSKACGFGCQMHHVTYCLIMAYGSNRTLVLDSQSWSYANGQGWTAVFEPLGECTTADVGQNRAHYSPNSNEKTIAVSIIDMGALEFAPSAIPRYYHDILATFHSNPPAWWVGQFVHYLMRPNADMRQFLEERKQKIEWQSPNVGMQVRRTDKIGSEASFHSLDEYMGPAEFYFDTHLASEKRRVIYLASDDPTVVTDGRGRFTKYHFANDEDSTNAAALSSRYTLRSLKGVVADVLFLSWSDYLVCTFSSQVCRLAFEAMQGRFVDASWRYTSLDDPWYYGGGQREHLYVWATPNKHQEGHDMLDIAVGDIIENHARNDGFYWKGQNRRTQQIGMYPAILVEPQPKDIKFPDYPGLGQQSKQNLSP